jgi:electron transfer flavoprotein alpha/beta subunit
MNIITCYKLIPEEQDIEIKGDRTLNFDKAEPKISLYDLNAVEAGMQLAAAAGGDGKVTALSVGAKRLENTKARKDILSRGPDSLTLVIDDALDGALPHETAQALAGAARKLEYDCILCGEGSGDLYAQQVGLLLGEMLGIPVVNAISKITPGQGCLTVERTLEHEVEVLEIPLPAVLCVTSDINVPKIPSMKAILAAGKKPVTTWKLEDVGVSAGPAPAALVSVLAPEQADRKKIIIEGDSDDNVAAFVEHLRKAM